MALGNCPPAGPALPTFRPPEVNKLPGAQSTGLPLPPGGPDTLQLHHYSLHSG